MTEIRKGGTKEFVFSVLWLIAIAAAYDLTDTFIRTYRGGADDGHNMFLTIGVILCGCVLVYLVIKHYAASYTYETTAKAVKISRKIGRREKNAEIRNKDICEFSKARPQNAKVHSMRVSVFSKKCVYYLTYINGSALEAVSFEPSEEMVAEISKRVKKG